MPRISHTLIPEKGTSLRILSFSYRSLSPSIVISTMYAWWLSIAVNMTPLAAISVLLHTPITMLHASQATSLDIPQNRSPVPEHGMLLPMGASPNAFLSFIVMMHAWTSSVRVQRVVSRDGWFGSSRGGQSLWKSYRVVWGFDLFQLLETAMLTIFTICKAQQGQRYHILNNLLSSN